MCSPRAQINLTTVILFLICAFTGECDNGSTFARENHSRQVRARIQPFCSYMIYCIRPIELWLEFELFFEKCWFVNWHSPRMCVLDKCNRVIKKNGYKRHSGTSKTAKIDVSTDVYAQFYHYSAADYSDCETLRVQSGPKSENRSRFHLWLCQILTDLPNSFTVYTTKKFSTSSHNTCVTL